MKKIWILAANSGNATLYSADAPIGPLTEIETFDNPEARVKEMELSSDRKGRSFDSQGAGRHAVEVQVGPKEQEQIRFAKTIVDRLEHGRVSNAFDHLVVVAAPAFLGQLRAHFHAPLSAMVAHEIDKDYTSMRADELRAHLPDRL